MKAFSLRKLLGNIRKPKETRKKLVKCFFNNLHTQATHFENPKKWLKPVKTTLRICSKNRTTSKKET
jgi:hypothetical protein